VLGLWPDHHVLVPDRLEKLIERRIQSPGDGNQLVEGDPAVPGLDTAQRRRAEMAAGGKRVQRPAASQSQTADALADHDLRGGQRAWTTCVPATP